MLCIIFSNNIYLHPQSLYILRGRAVQIQVSPRQNSLLRLRSNASLCPNQSKAHLQHHCTLMLLRGTFNVFSLVLNRLCHPMSLGFLSLANRVST